MGSPCVGVPTTKLLLPTTRYKQTRERLALRPLPQQFIVHERDRALTHSALFLRNMRRVVAGKAYHLSDGLIRIVEGSAIRDEGIAELMPDVYLVREILRDGQITTFVMWISVSQKA